MSGAIPAFHNGWTASELSVCSADRTPSYEPYLSVSQQLKQQILQPPTVLRPKFRVSKADRDESWHITSLCTGCRALSGISSARPFNHNTLSNCFKTWSLLRRHLDICRSITTASSRPWVCSHPLAPYRGNCEFSELVGVEERVMAM